MMHKSKITPATSPLFCNHPIEKHNNSANIDARPTFLLLARYVPNVAKRSVWDQCKYVYTPCLKK